MGGTGSGCRWSKVTTIEETKRIDIRWMRKSGMLRLGRTGRLSWNRGGEPAGWIQYTILGDRMQLDFKYREFGGEWQPVTQSVMFDRTPCNYGGFRQWFLCSRCSRRVEILCSDGPYFYCRKCCQLPYASQNEDTIGRMIKKRNNLRDRIFDDAWSYRRRKGMHKKTFEKLLGQFISLESTIDRWMEFKLNGENPSIPGLIRFL